MNVNSSQTGNDSGPGSGGIYYLLGLNNKFLPGLCVLEASGQNPFITLFKSNNFAEA